MSNAFKAKLAETVALLEHARDCHVETAKRAEKAEAEAAALQEALLRLSGDFQKVLSKLLWYEPTIDITKLLDAPAPPGGDGDAD